MLEDDFNDLVDYVVDLKNQYHQKIDEQSQRINDQMMIIDELCCQMRELGARVRSLTTRIENKSEFCVCNYENHSVRSSEKSYRVNVNRMGDKDGSISEPKQRWEDIYELALDDITKNDDEENIYEAIDLLSDKSSTLPPVRKIVEREIAEPIKVAVITLSPQNDASNGDEAEQMKDTTNVKRLINKTLPREATASVIFVQNEEAEEANLKKIKGCHDLRHLMSEEGEAELRTDMERVSSKVATCSLTSICFLSQGGRLENLVTRKSREIQAAKQQQSDGIEQKSNGNDSTADGEGRAITESPVIREPAAREQPEKSNTIWYLDEI